MRFRILRSFFIPIFIFTFIFPFSSDAMNRRKFQEQPPKLKDVQYHWCQPMNEKQLRQRAKSGMSFDREVGKEEGKMKSGFRSGKWTFWDKAGKKLAEGKCESQPPLRETQENGTWTYWDLKGRKIEMNWQYGTYNGLWTLYDPKGKKRWQFHIHDGEPKKELFSDEDYLKTENLRKEPPPRTAEDEEHEHEHN